MRKIIVTNFGNHPLIFNLAEEHEEYDADSSRKTDKVSAWDLTQIKGKFGSNCIVEGDNLPSEITVESSKAANPQKKSSKQLERANYSRKSLSISCRSKLLGLTTCALTVAIIALASFGKTHSVSDARTIAVLVLIFFLVIFLVLTIVSIAKEPESSGRGRRNKKVKENMCFIEKFVV